MADFKKLDRTLAYARLGLVSLTAAILPITGAAQELCGTDVFAGEPDAAELMDMTLEFLDILETNGVVAFTGVEGRMSVRGVRAALLDGVGSASLLSCVVNADSIEFTDGAQNQVIACDINGNPSLPQAEDSASLELLQGNGAGANSDTDDDTDTGEDADTDANANDDADTNADGGTRASAGLATGQLFCTTEIAAVEQYLSSEA